MRKNCLFYVWSFVYYSKFKKLLITQQPQINSSKLFMEACIENCLPKEWIKKLKGKLKFCKNKNILTAKFQGVENSDCRFCISLIPRTNVHHVFISLYFHFLFITWIIGSILSLPWWRHIIDIFRFYTFLSTFLWTLCLNSRRACCLRRCNVYRRVRLLKVTLGTLHCTSVVIILNSFPVFWEPVHFKFKQISFVILLQPKRRICNGSIEVGESLPTSHVNYIKNKCNFWQNIRTQLIYKRKLLIRENNKLTKS